MDWFLHGRKNKFIILILLWMLTDTVARIMEECFNCGASISRVRLFDAISDEGLIKICEKCSREEHIPIIRRPTTFQLKEAERKQSFYERASSSLNKPFERETPEKKEQEVTLREIVDRNYEQRIPKKGSPRPEMIDNFHWVVMRARRMKKLTQAQLAKQIAESEAAIKMAEQGILPEDDYRLVNKLENYLGIKIIRPEFTKAINPPGFPRRLGFGADEAKILTIDDLRRLREDREEDYEEFEDVEEIKFMEEEVEEAKPETSSDKGEISQEEMDKILFGN